MRFGPEGHYGYSFHSSLYQPADKKLGPIMVVVGGSGHDLEIVLAGHSLKTLHEFRKKRIGNLGNQKSQNAAAAGDKSASLRMGRVA